MFKESYFDRLQDWIQEGSKPDVLTIEESEYYNALYAILGVYRKYGRSNAINWVMRRFQESRRVAERMFSESLNLFFADDEVKKSAYINIIFNNLMEMALVLKKNAKTADDIEIIGRLYERAAKIKKLDEPEQQQTKQASAKSIKIYTLDAAKVGIPKINRDEIARQIDEMEIDDEQKVRIKADAGLEETNLEELVDDTKKRTEEIG